MKKMSYFLSLKKLVRIVGFQILLLIPYSVFAQTAYTVSISSVLVIAPYSAQLSAYVSNPSKVVITVQKTAGAPPINIKLFASLTGDNGIQITTNQAALSGLNQISLTAAQPTQVVNALYIRNLFDLDNVSIQGTTATDLQTNGLPAGNYQLCVQAVTADPDPFTGAQAGAPASDQVCGNSFNISTLSANVSIQNVLLIAPFTSKLSDFINNPSKVVITIHNGSTYPTFKVKLLASLKGDNGIQISTNPASLNLIPEITLQSGQPTVVLNATSVQNLFNLEGVNIQGITQNELVNGNGLPAGSYELCITPVMAVTDPATQQVAGQPLSVEKCSNSFTLLSPAVDISILNVLLIPPYSNRISDFLTNPSKVVITVHNSSTYPSFKVKLLASLKGDNGIQISTNPASLNLVSEITLKTGQPTIVLNATSLSNLFNLEGVNLKGITYNDLVNGDGLPEGSYELCITPVAAVADPATQQLAGQPLSVERCSNLFAVNNIEPPVIINPVSGFDMMVKVPQNIIFNWSIPAGVKPGIKYDFKIVEIQDTLRDANDAMQSATDPAFFERSVTSNVLLFGPGEPTLTPGFKYAYIVTASDPNNNAIFRNGGRSEVGYFIYKAAHIKNTPMPTASNNNPPSNPKNNPLPNPVPSPVPNPVPPPNIDLSQLTGDLNCSCKTQAPSGSVDNSDLKPLSKVIVGKFEMTIVSVTIANGKASGEGKMPIPFLNISQANIRVLFKDVTVARVNGTNVMLTGIVKAKRANDINLSPNVDSPSAGINPFTINDVTNLESYFTKNINKLISNIQNASIDFDMPLGIDKNIGGKKLIISLVDFTFTPEQAGFSACMAYTIPDDNTIISLGAKNICFNDASSFCGDLFLFLTDDIKINSLNLTLKAIAKNDSGTYVSFTKDGFRKLRVRADYEFSQKLIVSQANKGPVTATLIADVVNWNDWMATMNIDPFYLADNQDFSFNLKGVATYDHSDIRNPVGMLTKAIESQQLKKDNFLNKTWYGFLMPELDITLPAVFKNSKTNTPITVKVENMMIDNMGLTGEVHGDNILNIDDGNLDGWAYSLDSLGLRFVNNTYTDGGLRGKVLLPITNKNVQSQLDYKCTLTHESNDVKKPLAFNFVIKPKNTIEVPVFIATVDIDNTSSIVVKVDKDFSAVATLNGKMDISTPKNSSVPVMKLLGMEFQGLVLQSKPKYFTVKKFAMSLNSPPKESSGFPISLDSVKLTTDNGIGIRFFLNFTLADIKAMPKASSVFSITGNPVKMNNGKLEFDFNPVLKLEKISIDGDMSVLTVKGFIQFYNGDATYGDGFKGAIQATFPSLSVQIAAALQIGNVNGYSYWYVDALIDFGNTGIPMFPGTAAYGFGGGAFYNMKSNFDDKKTMDLTLKKSADVGFGQSPSDISYVPEQGRMGIKASIIFGLQQRETFNANVSMVLEFNSNGGIETFTLTGDARVISKDKDTYMGKGYLVMKYQFDKQIFDFNIQVVLKIAAVTGNGTLAMHAEPAGYYIKVGRAWPENSRINIKFGPLKANFYFQAGTMDLDDTPPIPEQIQQILAKSGVDMNKFYQEAHSDNLQSGSGLIFGGGLSLEAGGCFIILCGNLYAGVGFDVSLKHYTTDCQGNDTKDSQFGIDGWYAVGKAYAGVRAKIYIDLGVSNAVIFDAGAGAVLFAKLPNPEYFAGYVGGYYDIGIASGNFHFDFEYGKKCNPEGNPLSQLKLIADIDPHNDDKDVEINLNPQIGTNIEIGKYFTLDEDMGDHVRQRSFRFTKENIKVTLTAGEETIDIKKNLTESRLMAIFPTKFLETKTDYVLNITATLDEYIDGNWDIALKKDGKQFIEPYSIPFTTGNGIKELKLTDVKYTMPYQGERNFCYAKVAQGLISCWQVPAFKIFDIEHKDDPDSYVISFLVRFVPAGASSTNAKITEVPVTLSDNDFRFDIPTDLLKETIYAVQFISQWKFKGTMMITKNNPSQEHSNNAMSQSVASNGNQIFENKLINQRRLSLQPFQQKLFEFYFRTSKYSDYAEKMKTLEVLAGDFKAQGERDKYARTVNVGQKELGNPDKLKDLLSGSLMRHGNIINAYPLSFCVYGDEQYDVYDVAENAIENKGAGQTYNVKPLLDFKTSCFEDWAKSIYENLASTIRAGGLNALPLNTKGVEIFTDYNAAAMPPLTYNEMLTGINTSIAAAPALECGSGSTDPYVAQSSFAGSSGLSNNTISSISKSVNQSVNYGGFKSVTPSYSSQTASMAPDPVAQKWYTSKSLTLNVSFSYGSLMNGGGNNNNSIVSSNTVLSNLYGSSLNAGGSKQVSFSTFYQNMGNAYDKVASIQPVYVKDPCFKTNFNGVKRPGAQSGNDSMNISFGK